MKRKVKRPSINCRPLRPNHNVIWFLIDVMYFFETFCLVVTLWISRACRYFKTVRVERGGVTVSSTSSNSHVYILNSVLCRSNNNRTVVSSSDVDRLQRYL